MFPAMLPIPRTIRLSLLATALMLAQACVPAGSVPDERPRPLEPLEFVEADGERLFDAQFVGRAADADFVLIGETHDNVCHHRAQARALDLLARTANPPAIGLEMVAVDRQPVLEMFNSGELDLESLPEALNWHGEWGVAFEKYAPVFLVAQQVSLPVFALNVPKRLIDPAASQGIDTLPGSDRALLPPRVIDPPREQHDMLLEAFAAHGASADLNDPRVRRFFFVQSLWDSQMAHQAIQVRRYTGRPVVILAGAGHVAHGWGIPHRLLAFDANARIFTLLPWSGEAPPPEGAADAYYYCPRGQRPEMANN